MVPVGLFASLLLMHRVCFCSTLFLHLLFLCSEKIVTEDIPANLKELAQEKRRELVEVVSEVDDQLAEAFLSDEPISAADLEVYFFHHSNKISQFCF